MSEIPWTYVSRLMSAAANAAEERGLTIAIAVTDRDGTLIGALRMPGVPPLLGRIALAKAYSAASFRRDTEDLAELEASRPSLFGAAAELGDQPMIASAGGVVIRDLDQVLAAIGVSGGSGEQDVEIARAAMGAHPVGAWVRGA